MAGFAYGFDEGGAIPDDETQGGQTFGGQTYGGNTFGGQQFGGQQFGASAPADDEAAPAPDNSTEAAPADDGAIPAPDNAGEPPQSRSGLRAPHEALRNAGRSVLAYLMGADAAPPQVAQKFATGVKAEYPGVSDDDANVLAVHKALELGGPDAAWQMVQYNRTAYNAKQAFAFTALMGTPQKPADPQAAAQAATQASQHILDGSQAQFTATPDGFITATVKMPGSGQPVSYNLSPEQFAQYLNVGKDGQWDRVMEQGGVPGTLQRLSSKAPGAATTSAKSSGASGTHDTADTYEDDDTDTGDMSPIVRKGTNDGSNFGKTPSTLDLSNGETETFTPRDDLEARATRLFPSASQGAQRRQYMATQMDQAAQGRRALRQAEARGDAMRDVAGIRGQAQVGAAGARAEGTIGAADKRLQGVRETNEAKTGIEQQKLQQRAADLQQRIKQMEVTHGDRVNRQRLDAASRRLNNVNAAITKGGPEDVQNAMSELQTLESELGSSRQPQAAQPQQAQPQQAQRAPLSLKDQQALQWAKANPNDPRAAKILQHLGQ